MIFLKKNTVSAFKFFLKLLMLALIFTAVSYAKTQDANAPRLGDDSNILTIMPSSTAPITVTSSGTTTVSYTATLASTVTDGVTNIGIDPGFNMSSTLVTASLQSDHCSGQSLAASASCTFTVALQGVSGKTGSATLMPRMSVNRGQAYSVPISDNRIAVTVSGSAPPITLQSITITPATATVPKGLTQQFTAVGHYSDGSTADITTSVTWSSVTTSVAMIVSNTGLATAVAASGTSDISATLSSITSTSPAVLTATAAELMSVAITSPADPTVTVLPTQTYQFVATGTYSDNTTAPVTSDVTWASSSTSAATISNTSGTNGLATVTTNVNGNAYTTISAALNGTIIGSKTLTVPALTAIVVTPSGGSTNIPGTINPSPLQMTATGTYSTSDTLTITSLVDWTSSNSSYAAVTTSGSTRGQVTGVSVPAGSTTTSVVITATAPSTSISNTQDITVNLVVGSSYNQGYVYCLGTGSGNCAFLPSGNCPSGSPCVGEVTNSVDAAKVWWNGSYTTTSATSDTNGAANTTAIISAQGEPTGTGYAANYCKNYNSGDTGGNWYLPAKNELNVIYDNRTPLNTAGANLTLSGVYWSSTESDLTYAWNQDFKSNGVRLPGNKVSNGLVRCVRAF